MTLYPQYHGPDAQYSLAVAGLSKNSDFFEIVLICAKEIAVGYIIGFCFNVVFEAMMMTGELVDNMIGFSTAHFLDPFSFEFHSLFGYLFIIAGSVLMLVVDFHHTFIRLVAESFWLIPIGEFRLSPEVIYDLANGTSWIFIYAVKFGAIAIIILSTQIIGIAFTVRVVPEMNLLLTGLPMRILFAFLVMLLSMGRVQPIYKESFQAVSNLAESIVEHMSR